MKKSKVYTHGTCILWVNLTSGVFVGQCIKRDDVDICESKSTNWHQQIFK
jgi:hypothetical protein